MRSAITIFALWLSAASCFDQRCDMATPALIESSYLRPSFLFCKKGSWIYMCKSPFREFAK